MVRMRLFLQIKKHNPQLRVLLFIGWNWLETMTNNTADRILEIVNGSKWTEKNEVMPYNQFDGVLLPYDVAKQEPAIVTALRKHGYVISLLANLFWYSQPHPTIDIIRDIDSIHVFIKEKDIPYTFENFERSLEKWGTILMNKRKILIVLAFQSYQPYWEPYSKICSELHHNSSFNASSKMNVVTYEKNNKTIRIFYEDVSTLKFKTDLIKQAGYGGAMIEYVNSDDQKGKCGQRYPLLNFVHEELRGTSKTIEPDRPSNTSTPKTIEPDGPSNTSTPIALILSLVFVLLMVAVIISVAVIIICRKSRKKGAMAEINLRTIQDRQTMNGKYRVTEQETLF